MNGNEVSIVGIGATEFSKGSGRTELELAVEAVTAAIADAGLTAADVDGFVTYTIDASPEHEVMRNIRAADVHWMSRTPYSGTGTCGVLVHASAAIASGAAHTVVVYRALNGRSGPNRFGGGDAAWRRAMPDTNMWASWIRPYGLTTPAQQLSLQYMRYMHAYGLSNEDFGRYAVQTREYAATNPRSWFYKRPIDLADHQRSRWIVEPVLRMLDCCQETDGGVALVVTSADRAADRPHPPVDIVSAVQGVPVEPGVTTNYHRPHIEIHDGAQEMASRLYAQAGIDVTDLSATLLYDNFVPNVFLLLEGFGVCAPGEAAAWFGEGHGARGGDLPVNPHGGLIGEGYIHGLNHLVEAVRQLRGTAANQVADAELVLVGCDQSAAVLGRRR